MAAVLGVVILAATPAAADETLWALLRNGGQVIVIRHATAPGTFDPPGMRFDDCATQRNLDDHGRDEARRIGAAFRTREIPVGSVRSSRWCRCLETARLAFSRVDHWEALDGFSRDDTGAREAEARRTGEVRALATAPFSGLNIVLVTHQFNIRALTGLSSIGSGELVVLSPRGRDFAIAGRLLPGAFTATP